MTLATTPGDAASAIPPSKEDSGQAASRTPSWLSHLSVGNIGAVYVWVLIIAIFALWSPSLFLQGYTLRAITSNYAVTGLAALAVLVPMACGSFDASIGGNMSLSGVVCAYLLTTTGLSLPLVIVLTLATGLAIGIVNSIIVVALGIPSLIGTLAMWLIADALSVGLSGNASVYSTRTSSGAFKHVFWNANWSGFTIAMVYVVAIAVLLGVVLTRTVSGRYVYAVGFNETAAKLAGIRTKAVQAGSFMCSGVIGAFAGIVLTAQISSASPAGGDTYLLPAFAAVFVGATQFKAHRFNAMGTLIAVFMLGTGQYGLLDVGAPQWMPNVFQGVALMAAIGLTHLYDPSRSTRRRTARAARRGELPRVSKAVPAAPAATIEDLAAPALPARAQNGSAAASPVEASGPAPEAGLPSIELVRLSKTFPGQRALIDVDMEVRQGEIHALLGQNGSGKSTLIKILAGIYTPDPGGIVRVCGKELPFGSPRDSRRMGLQFVHQSLGIIEELTAVENIALGFGYVREVGTFINWPAQRRKTRRLLGKLSIDFDINCPVSQLKPVERSAIAIARALDDDGGATRVLVLDEPTAALPPHEVDTLFALVRQARQDGTSVIYVSHRLNEIFQLAERTTVLRDGTSQGTINVGDIDHETLVRMIVGEDDAHDAIANLVATAKGASSVGASHEPRSALRARGLSAQLLEGVDFDVDVGEILGFAGLSGSGREELAGALVGEGPSRVELENAQGTKERNPTPRQAKDLGVVLVLPNRAAGAAIMEFTMRENISLPSLARDSRRGVLNKTVEEAHATRWIAGLDIRPKDPERLYALLSGGNQQKVVFAKWLSFAPKVMVLEDPTSGVDVGARQAIYDLITRQARAGVSFVVCSSDTDDLLAICDRVLVLREGHVVDELVGADIEEGRVLTAMVGGTPQTSSPNPRTLEPVGE
jgi:ribose transport system ATP-binding protein